VVLIGVPRPGFFTGPPDLYPRLAARHRLVYEGEVLQDVLYDNALKSDHVHPNARGYRRLAEALAGLLGEAGAVP
jgi:lysophospholipase L1-like esterase